MVFISLSFVIASRFCTAIPLKFCILPAISKPAKTTKLETISITVLYGSNSPLLYLIMELKIIAHIPNLNTRIKIKFTGTITFSTLKYPFLLSLMLFSKSPSISLFLPKDFITPIPFTNSKVLAFNSIFNFCNFLVS